MYKILDLLALCKHHIQVPHSLSGIYLYCLARDMHKTNGVTFPGSPLSMMEQELGKKLPSFSSAPHSLHKPVSDSLGLVEMLNISQKKSFLQHTRWGEGRKTQRERFWHKGATEWRRGRTLTWHAEMPISELSLPESVAHELFPGTFFSLSDLELTKHLLLFQEQPSRQCQKQYITTTAIVIDMSSENCIS